MAHIQYHPVGGFDIKPNYPPILRIRGMYIGTNMNWMTRLLEIICIDKEIFAKPSAGMGLCWLQNKMFQVSLISTAVGW